MADTVNPNQSTEPATAGAAAIVVELERLLGTARAAANEATASQQNAAKAANDAELARAKAAEHLLEIEAKRESANTETTTINSLAATSATRSAHIDGGVKYADESRTEIARLREDITAFKSQIDGMAKKATDDSAGVTSLLTDLAQKRAELAPIMDDVASLRTKALETTAVAERARDDTALLLADTTANKGQAALNCQHIEEGKAYVDAERAKIDGYAETANQKLIELTQAAVAAQEKLTTITNGSTTATTTLTHIDEMAASIRQTKESAETDRQTTEKLAQLAVGIEGKINDYEIELARLKKEFGNMQTEIERLLPGATSAGLAFAFHQQKAKYSRPRSCWNFMFFVALAGLAVIGGIEIIIHLSGPPPEYNEIIRSLLVRLPIVVALIWLALHAGNKSRIANQIQEDYAYKEVVSQSFEGYKREFRAIEKQEHPESPMGTLCTSVVSIIAASPSRVYDKHSSDPTPISTATDLVKELAVLVKEAKLPPVTVK